MEIKPTKEEQNAINTLKRLAKRWPKSLWLFSASGSLCVMRCGKDGKQVMIPFSHAFTVGGGVDQNYILDSIDIPNDGGDW